MSDEKRTEEEIDRLVEERVRAVGLGAHSPIVSPSGLGAAKSIGLGCGEDAVVQMLHHGYPRLALVRALGVPLAPWVINIPFTFDTPEADQVLANQGTDGTITQDVFVEAMVARLTIDRTPISPFDAPSDFALNFTSGIEATLQVDGTPRYEVTTDFTPISTLIDVFNGNARWPFSWCFTYQQQLKMQLRNRIQLPDAPVTMIISFRGWQPVTDLLVNMTNRQAVARLRQLGYTVPDSYLDYLR
jgi:hypothetical protein